MDINCSKISYTIFCVLVSIQIGYAQDSLSISGKYENSNIVDRNDTFLLNNNCRFFIVDIDGNKRDLNSCVWRFECLNEDSIYVVDREIKDSNEFDFLLNDLNVNSSLLKRINADDSSSVLFQARILCVGQTSSGEKFDLSFPVYLNLLPSIPKINILSIMYTFNDYWNSFDVSIKLNNILSDRADNIEFVTKIYDYPYTNIYSQTLSGSEYNFSYYVTDSVEFDVYGSNKFGTSFKAIKLNYADLPTGLNEINKESELSFYPNPFSDVIHIKGDYRDIDKLIITDIDGKTIKIMNKIELPAIQVANLPKGMYLITVSQKQNSRNKSFKLIKK